MNQQKTVESRVLSMFEFLDTPRWAYWNIKVHYSKFTSEWNVEGKSYDRGNVKANSTYGTPRINAYRIIEETLNLKDVRIYDYVEDAEGKKKAVLNKKETAIAQAKQVYGAQNGITVKSNSDSELGMRLVAYLPELHCAVDIAGATVTEKREQSVKAHICQSNRLGYYLIKRTVDTSQMAAEIKTLFIRNHIYLHTDSEKDVQVLRERFLEWKYRNACKLNGKY